MSVDLSIPQMLLVVVAGLLAGGANALAGGGTLIAYPILVALGIPPVTANITCSVGLLPGYAGAAHAYRRHLGDVRSLLTPLLAAALVGGLLGAALLLALPDGGFELVVPPLILMAVVLLMLQPRIGRWVAARAEANGGARSVPWGLVAAVLLCGAYGSFFGAGLGVMLMAALGVFLTLGMQEQNGIKSLLSFAAVAAGVIVYIAVGGVAWLVAGLLLVASYTGGQLGARFAQRLSNRALRLVIIVLGLVVAVVLALRTYSLPFGT